MDVEVCHAIEAHLSGELRSGDRRPHCDVGEVVPRVLFGDGTRVVDAAHSEGRAEVEDRCLRLIDLALRQGDDDVVDLVAVSFVEHTAPWEEATRVWATSWPSGLREEAERRTQ